MSGPLPDWTLPATAPASWLYRGAIAWRNRHYNDARRVHRLNVPVISVGNLTTGGVGKTPMVMWIVQHLLSIGRRPVIALRGYGAGPGELSDEETEYMQRLPEVDVVVHPDRYQALSGYLDQRPEVDCAVLDDGFQHRQLHRDLDLVLVDATRETWRERMLPAGHLREPVRNLNRADAVLVTRCTDVDSALSESIQAAHGRPALAWCRHAWTHLDWYDADGHSQRPADELDGLRAITLLGVGNPGALRAQLERHGVTIVQDHPVRDHQRYTRAQLDALQVDSAEASALIVTGKDWVKIEPLLDWTSWSMPVIVPRVSLDVHTGAINFRAMLESICPPVESMV
ncbi:MAG: tetraacyldisaccharide 4'-kinase [Planctomycetota bacterium]